MGIRSVVWAVPFLLSRLVYGQRTTLICLSHAVGEDHERARQRKSARRWQPGFGAHLNVLRGDWRADTGHNTAANNRIRAARIGIRCSELAINPLQHAYRRQYWGTAV